MNERGEGSAGDEPHGGSSRSEAEASPDHLHWFEPIADHLGPAYLRYSFTKGTLQEVDFVIDALLLKTGDRVVTASGIHGLISNVKETTVIVKVADNVKIEMEKSAVTNVLKPAQS